MKAYDLPQAGYLRIWQIIGNAKANPPIPPLLPISKTTWWQGVKTGRYPSPVKLGPKITVWKAEDIRAILTAPPDDWKKV